MLDRLIVISSPVFFKEEGKILNQLFEAGLMRLHLRKPQGSKQELEKLISGIDFNFRKLITIHYHTDLALEMNLGGIHFSYSDVSNDVRLSDKYTVSCSLHQWKELIEVQQKIDYCFMSPVFNSISKVGYQANEVLKTVPAFTKNVYALGGIAESNCIEALNSGYSGVAVLGTLWEDKNNALQRFKVIQQKLKVYGK